MHEVDDTTAPGTQPLIELADVTFSYEGANHPVWEGLSLAFDEGKLHAVCGPSGCGKSSLLALIDGLVPHLLEGEFSGSVRFEGNDITAKHPHERCEHIGLVMQHPESQFCTFTVAEELAFGMENLALPRDEMDKRIRIVLSFVGLEGLEERNLDDLSGGQKQKVAIASVLVMRPRVLLLDEPTANLDPPARAQVLDVITRLVREQNTTVILVEHNIDDIFEAVDVFTLLDARGAVQFHGPRENFERERWLPQPPGPEACYAPRLAGEQTVLRMEGLRFSYDKRATKRYRRGREDSEQPNWVLNSIDFVLKRQEFLAVVGRNGAGKSTLAKLALGIERPVEGHIELFGKPLASYKSKELYQRVGLVFQDPESQFVTNTVLDELLFSLKRTKLPEHEKLERVETMLGRFDLQECRDASPFSLSQGQKRRLSVATMLLTKQELLFLDEPTYGQDHENRHELMRGMQRLVESGVTIVMITHDLELVRSYATRVVELAEGRLVCDLDTRSYFVRQRAQG